MNLPESVRIVEVGPRDGLQNEAAAVATDAKVAFVNALAAAGHSTIEVSAFVSPKWVPQMADAADVFGRIERRGGVRFTALVPNLAGLARAREARVDEIAIFAAASETFSRRNINQSVAAPRYAVRRRTLGCGCGGTSLPCSAARSRAPCRSQPWPRSPRN